MPSKDEVKKIITKWLQGSWFRKDDLVAMYEKMLGEKNTNLYMDKERLARELVLNCSPNELLRMREALWDAAERTLGGNPGGTPWEEKRRLPSHPQQATGSWGGARQQTLTWWWLA